MKELKFTDYLTKHSLTLQQFYALPEAEQARLEYDFKQVLNNRQQFETAAKSMQQFETR